MDQLEEKNNGAHFGRLEDTNNERLSLAMPHSGLKPKNENEPKEEDDIPLKTTFDGRQF